MASNARKQGGRVTPKGTKPAVKASKGPGSAPGAQPGRVMSSGQVGPVGKAGKAGGGGASGDPAGAGDISNRQMRRAGYNVDTPVNPQQSRMKLVLIISGVVAALLVIALIVIFRLSGTWIGILGVAAGIATGLAVATGKTWVADKGRMVAIGIAAVGVIVTAIGASGVVDFHWPFVALLGCGLGALFAEVSVQQMTAPPSPPASAIALLRRSGAQQIDAPAAGGCLWATPDGRIRVIVGATLPEGTSGEKVLTTKTVRRSRQRGSVIVSRMSSAGVESGVTCVVDTVIATVTDGDDVVCSSAGLNKALSR